MKWRSRLFFVLLLLILLFAPGRAHAYIDPGTGSLLWQLLFAAGVGSVFYLRKTFSWLRKLRPRRKVNASHHAAGTATLKSGKEASESRSLNPNDH
jgi:hypothetical protein